MSYNWETFFLVNYLGIFLPDQKMKVGDNITLGLFAPFSSSISRSAIDKSWKTSAAV